ncbi:MAG: T9SS type A sorting domain-containing protein [Calditrichota bacterium]
MAKFVSFLTVCVIAVGTPASAQPVIRPEDIPQQPGSVFTYYVAADQVDGIIVDIGQSGENRQWDLSGYIYEDLESDTLIDPEQAPNADDFPRANRVIRSLRSDLGINLGAGYQYETVADTGWHALGTKNDQLEAMPPTVFPNPMLILPLPVEFGASWDIGANISYGMVAPDTIGGGLLDSLYLRITIGGNAEIDGWGTILFSGGAVEAFRQHILAGMTVRVIGTRVIFGQRLEIPIYENIVEATHSYRWFAPDIGEIAAITSRAGEQEPNFNIAASIRTRQITPALVFPGEPLSFGIVHLGNAGMANLTISNGGEGMGIISRIVPSEAIAGEIELVGELPFQVNSGAEGRLRLIWMPQIERTLVGQTLQLFHNDPEQDNPAVIRLAGQTSNWSGVEFNPLAGEYDLLTVHPNPFNDQTTIQYYLQADQMVELSLCDLSGRTVQLLNSSFQLHGAHEVAFRGSDIAGGVYLVRLRADGAVRTVKLALVK